MTEYKTLVTGAILSGLLWYNPPETFAADVTGTLVQTIYTSQFSVPSPDPSDIAYLNSSNRLIICDGEVDEMPIYAGANLFEMTLTGSLVATANTLAYSNEPVGCAYNPGNGHLFISSDDQKTVFEINPGSDGVLFTPDDIRMSFSTSPFGNNDPEGVAFDTVEGALYIADGLNSEVYKVLPGPDRRFDITGDNIVTHFDTESLGIHDPEGIEFEPPNRLFLVGKPPTQMAQIYSAGPLIRMVDISSANAMKPAGLTRAPASSTTGGGSVMNVFIVDRGVDNDSDPNENDGKVYEFSVPPLPTGNQPPAVAAGPDLTIILPRSANLNGAIVDDGLPSSPGTVTISWSKVSGPGTVTFSNPNTAVTSASFGADGVYVLRLTSSDGELVTSDDVAIQVRQPFSAPFTTIYVSSTSSDKIGEVTFGDEDIIAYDTVSASWSLLFDGSDVGLGDSGVDVNAFDLLEDGSILLSFVSPTTVTIDGNPTLIDDSDIVRFIPTSLGDNTAGSFEWFFDGSDVGLTTDSEDIDAIGFLPDGRLVISTVGSCNVPGLSCQDEDLIVFSANDLGSDTNGTWEMYFDGSDVELGDGGDAEDVNGVWIDNNNDANSDIYLTTKGAFTVSGASGAGDDIFRCVPVSTGLTTVCDYDFIWDGISSGLPNGVVIDGIDLVRSEYTSEDTTAPTVFITGPLPGSSHSGIINITADATDDTAVAGVQFLLDDAPLGAEDTAAPYNVDWDTTTALPGSHTLSAVARDAAGNATTSATVAVQVDNSAPSATLTAPADGAAVSGAVTLSADASDNVAVAGVQFLLDDAPLGAEDVTAPYSVDWDTTTAPAGSHTLSAVARDAAGNATTSTTLTVQVDNSAPSATLTAPADGAMLSGAVTLSADASDNLAVAGVQFLLDGAPLGAEDATAPYSVDWDTTTASAGSHTLSAVARDSAGNTTGSTMVTVMVDNTIVMSFSPVADAAIKLSSPSSNYGTSQNIGVRTSNANTVENFLMKFSISGIGGKSVVSAKLRIYNKDSSNKGGDFYRVADSSWTENNVTWNSAPAADSTPFASLGAVSTNTWYEVDVSPLITGDGAFSLRVLSTSTNWAGYDSKEGQNKPELIVSVNDVNLPTVNITNPVAGATVSGIVPVVASASNELATAGVQFLLDGNPLGAEDTVAPYSVDWDTITGSAGSHALSAVVRDTAGNTAWSAVITVNVDNSSPDNDPPYVTITEPLADATVSGTIPVSANAGDNVAVAGVQFLLDGAPLGAEDTAAPYSVNWDTTTVSSGNHALSAVARDSAGNLTNSAPVTVTVSNLVTLTFIPTADASIKFSSPNNNYGSSKNIGVRTSTTNTTEDFLMKFSISGIGGKSIISAKLRLYNKDSSDRGGDFYRLANTSWSESGVTWNNAPAADSSPFAILADVSINTWYEVDLLPLITGDGVFSLRVMSTSTNWAGYVSKEGPQQPELIITVE